MKHIDNDFGSRNYTSTFLYDKKLPYLFIVIITRKVRSSLDGSGVVVRSGSEHTRKELFVLTIGFQQLFDNKDQIANVFN